MHRVNQYAYSLNEVKANFGRYQNVHCHPALFRDSTASVVEQQCCFVPFDVDLYVSTVSRLEYFYPRMIRGGIVLSHDCGILAGVEQAYQESPLPANLKRSLSSRRPNAWW